MTDELDRQAMRLSILFEEAGLIALRELSEALKRGNWNDVHHVLKRDKELRRLSARIARVMNTASQKSSLVIDQLAMEEYSQAIEEVFSEVNFASTPYPTYAAINTVQALSGTATAKIASTTLQVVRDVTDVYRSITTQTVQSAIIAGVDHRTAMRHALNQYADRGITAFVDRAGRRWSLDSYVDMSVRTMRNQATQEGHLSGYEQAGVELVRASWHTASAPQCYPFQNELLAISGGAGVREMVDPATGDKVTVTVKDTLRGAISKGYKHVNCRHREYAYTPGDPTPQVPMDSPAENKRKYKATQQQRYMERQLRRWKRREAVALSPLDRDTARAKTKEWNRRIREHVNNHEHLTRWSHREQPRS